MPCDDIAPGPGPPAGPCDDNAPVLPSGPPCDEGLGKLDHVTKASASRKLVLPSVVVQEEEAAEANRLGFLQDAPQLNC